MEIHSTIYLYNVGGRGRTIRGIQLTQFRQCNKISRRAVLVTVLALIVSDIQR